MKANPEKSHILLSNKKTEKVAINDAALTSGVEEKLLGFVLDSGLKSEKHVTGIYNKASEKTCFVQNYKLHAAEETKTSYENVCRICLSIQTPKQ